MRLANCLRPMLGLLASCTPLGCSASSTGAPSSTPPPLVPVERVEAGVAALEQRLESASHGMEVAIDLPTGAPYQGELESGHCIVRAAIEFRGGKKRGFAVPCAAEYREETAKIVCDTVVLRGTIRGGRVRLSGREHGKEILLDGQATSRNRLAGQVLEAGGDEKEWDVLHGRWEIFVDGS